MKDGSNILQFMILPIAFYAQRSDEFELPNVIATFAEIERQGNEYFTLTGSDHRYQTNPCGLLVALNPQLVPGIRMVHDLAKDRKYLTGAIVWLTESLDNRCLRQTSSLSMPVFSTAVSCSPDSFKQVLRTLRYG